VTLELILSAAVVVAVAGAVAEAIRARRERLVEDDSFAAAHERTT
jgi:hypothetical protein